MHWCSTGQLAAADEDQAAEKQQTKGYYEVLEYWQSTTKAHGQVLQNLMVHRAAAHKPGLPASFCHDCHILKILMVYRYQAYAPMRPESCTTRISVRLVSWQQLMRTMWLSSWPRGYSAQYRTAAKLLPLLLPEASASAGPWPSAMPRGLSQVRYLRYHKVCYSCPSFGPRSGLLQYPRQTQTGACVAMIVTLTLLSGRHPEGILAADYAQSA